MKIKTLPSIFNDVIGPVMRGPSSSHTAASWRIAMTGIQLLNDELESALIEFDKDGIWASNYREQGTAIGMDGGLLGIDITDERIIQPETIAKERGISIHYQISSFETDHTNTVRLTLKGTSGKKIQLIAVSTGGGMFEIRKYSRAPARHLPNHSHPTDIRGDNYYLFISTAKNAQNKIWEAIKEIFPPGEREGWTEHMEEGLIQLKSPHPFSAEIRKKINALPDVMEVAQVDPVLPIISGNESDIPFSDPASMLKFAAAHNYSLGELGLIYECRRSGLPEDALLEKMKQLIQIIEQGISRGLKGTEYKDRILHQQAKLIQEAEHALTIKTPPLMNRTISYITALMESKSAMKVIVAVPTAGSCGTFGGTVKAFCDTNNLKEDRKTMSYFSGGMIGVFFAMGPGFSAEEHGCQVETGAAGCMAAAALVELSGGNAQQAVNAASMALQNSIGLICDPVADRVEVPCLGKNVAAGMNALAASSMALSGFDPVIPLDQVIATVKRVGRMMSPTLCNSGKGGLAITNAAKALKERLGN